MNECRPSILVVSDVTDGNVRYTWGDNGRCSVCAARAHARTNEPRGSSRVRSYDPELAQVLVHAVQLLLAQPGSAALHWRPQ